MLPYKDIFYSEGGFKFVIITSVNASHVQPARLNLHSVLHPCASVVDEGVVGRGQALERWPTLGLHGDTPVIHRAMVGRALAVARCLQFAVVAVGGVAAFVQPEAAPVDVHGHLARAVAPAPAALVRVVTVGLVERTVGVELARRVPYARRLGAAVLVDGRLAPLLVEQVVDEERDAAVARAAEEAERRAREEADEKERAAAPGGNGGSDRRRQRGPYGLPRRENIFCL